MEKIQSRMGCSGESFTVMTPGWFHAQRLNEYGSCERLSGNLKMLPLDPFQNKTSMPVTSGANVTMLQTCIRRSGVSFNDI